MGNSGSQGKRQSKAKLVQTRSARCVTQHQHRNALSSPTLHHCDGLRFRTFQDKYHTLEEVQSALRIAGLESSNLIIGGCGSQRDVRVPLCHRHHAGQVST